MIRARIVRTLLAASIIACFCERVHSQAPPSLGYAYPPVIQAGEETPVRLGGYDLTDDIKVFCHHEHVRLKAAGPVSDFFVPPPPYWFGEKGRSTAFPIPREIPATFTADAVDEGFALWQVANANGASATAVVYISQVEEYREERQQDDPQTLPVLQDQQRIGVSGRLERIAEVDRYMIQRQTTGAITIRLMARQLGANFNGVLKVKAPDGALVADVADTEGRDAVISFIAKGGVAYELSLHDVDYRGNRAMVYRLDLSAKPWVPATLPASFVRGETRTVQFVGWGIATGANQWERLTEKVQVPATPPQQGPSGVEGWPYPLSTVVGAGEVWLSAGAAAEAETGTSQPFTGPFTITGDFATDVPGRIAEHVYMLRAGKGSRWTIAAGAVSEGLDLALRVVDSNGKVLGQNDDANGSSNSQLTFRAAEDGSYHVHVTDQSGKSGIPRVYQLQIQDPKALPPSIQLSTPQSILCAVGGKASIKVTAVRTNYDGEIPIHIDGLPDGVTAPEKVVIAEKKTSVSIALDATNCERCTSHVITIRGKTNEPSINATSQAEAGGSLVAERKPATSRVLLTTTLKPKFQLQLIDKNRQRAVHRGTTYPAPFVIARDDGFTGAVQIMMAAKQGRHRQGIWGPIISVPPSTNKAFYPCHMPEWLETDRTTRMVVIGVAQQTDPAGQSHLVTEKADARITMILEGALLRIAALPPAHGRREYTAVAGKPLVVPLAIARSKKLNLPVKIHMELPEPIRNRLQMKPIHVAATESNATAKIVPASSSETRGAEKKLTGTWPLTFVATTMEDGKWEVRSQVTIEVDFE